MARQFAKVIGLVYFDNATDENSKKPSKNGKRDKKA
jgi:hypothetical protein